MHWKPGLALLLVVTASSTAEEFRLESVGTRLGLSANERTDDIYLADVVTLWNLPSTWRIGGEWRVKPWLQLTAGGLFGDGADVLVASGGPIFSLDHAKFPVVLEIAATPALLSRKRVGETDFGSLIQFTSHAGLNWNIGAHFRVGYAFQHMSNAGLTDHNPGLNVHVFSAAYRF